MAASSLQSMARRRSAFGAWLGALALLAATSQCGGDAPSAPAPAGVPQASSEPTEEQRRAMAALESLGYAAATDKPLGVTGVTRHERERAFRGLNLYVSGHGPEAILIDMEGTELHRWGRRFEEVWPGRELPKGQTDPSTWRRAWLRPDGSLFAIFEGLGLIKLDRASNLVWAYAGLAHHDLDFAADGRILVLTRKARIDPGFDAERPILEDFVTTLDADGRELESVSLLACLRDSPFLSGDLHAAGDIFHTNTLQILDGAQAALAPAFAAGNVLVSLRNTNQLAVVDLRARRAVWALSGPWKRQHEPQLLANGRVLLFDNRGLRKRSRVLELEPLTGAVAWSYAPEGERAFYSERCGSCQRLGNGDTLVVDSEGGRALEVDPRGETVWEFHNPNGAPGDPSLVSMLFDLVRLDAAFPTEWLRR